MALQEFGSGCFGLVVGWITCRTLKRQTNVPGSITDIVSLIGALASSGVIAFKDPRLFGAYGSGLATGFFLCLLVTLITDVETFKAMLGK